MKKSLLLMVFGFVIFCGGCGVAVETAKTFWGSSTRALENARDEAISKSYVCGFDNCFDAILDLAEIETASTQGIGVQTIKEEASEETNEGQETQVPKFFKVFVEDRIKSHIVVIGVPGNVDTTEVGIFFAKLDHDAYRIDISSLSSSAKRKVAEAVFADLDRRFPAYNQ